MPPKPLPNPGGAPGSPTPKGPLPPSLLPRPVHGWGAVQGLLEARWEWLWLSLDAVQPLHDRDAYRHGKILLGYIGSAGDVHYYAGACPTLSLVYWCASRPWDTLTFEEALGR